MICCCLWVCVNARGRGSRVSLELGGGGVCGGFRTGVGFGGSPEMEAFGGEEGGDQEAVSFGVGGGS